MLHIAAGVCLGILAAVLILNWWQAHLVRRAERRERKAYRKMMRAYEKAAQEAAQEAEYRANCEAEHQAWLAKQTPKPVREISDTVVSGAFWMVVTFWVLAISIGLLASLVS